MSELEFNVEDAGQPNLEAPPQQQQLPLQTPVATGWTQDEAAQVVGGMVANLTAILYLVKWQAPPPVEVWPAIAGDPKNEFPLMGAALAPMLDFLAPKGSLPGLGVSLTAGISEVVGAVARRATVLQVPPKKEQEKQRRRKPEPVKEEPVPQEEGTGFKFNNEQLSALGAFGYE